MLLAPGTPGQLLAHLLDTGDPYRAVAAYLEPLRRMPLGTFLAQQTWSVVIPVYGLLGIRYMRERIRSFEPRCLDLCPGGPDTWSSAFRLLPRVTPVVVILVPLIVIFVPSIAQRLAQTPGPFTSFQFLAGILIFNAAIAGFVWVYAAAVKGLYDLGREPLNLRPFYEHAMLGARPLGALSLQLSYLYFGGVAIGALFAITSSNPPDPRILGLVLGTTLLGVVLFILPLNSVHLRMAEAKHRELSSFRKDLRRLSQSAPEPPSDERGVVTELKEALTLGMVRAEITAIPTWPLDTTILGKLAAIVIVAAGIVIARLIQVQLGIA